MRKKLRRSGDHALSLSKTGGHIAAAKGSSLGGVHCASKLHKSS